MILIDGFPLVFPFGGIKSYTSSLIQALNTYSKHPEEYTVLVPRLPGKLLSIDHEAIDTLRNAVTNVKVESIPINEDTYSLLTFLSERDLKVHRYFLTYWEYFVLPNQVRKRKPKTVFHPYQIVTTYRSSARKIVTVHDVFHWQYQERYNLIERFFYNQFKEGVRQANKLITISHAAQQTVAHTLRVPESRIKICYEGIGEQYLSFEFNNREAAKVKKQYHLPSSYLLAFSSDRSYKNTLGILKILSEIRNLKSEIHLVLIGNEPTGESKRFIREQKLHRNITVIHHLHNSHDLPYLYALSSLFLFPSFEEGFGLPPLEALACGTLPLVSNTSALGEIFGDYVPSFDPTDHASFAQEAIELLDHDAKRKRLIRVAKRSLLAQYSWQNIVPLYEKVLL